LNEEKAERRQGAYAVSTAFANTKYTRMEAMETRGAKASRKPRRSHHKARNTPAARDVVCDLHPKYRAILAVETHLETGIPPKPQRARFTKATASLSCDIFVTFLVGTSSSSSSTTCLIAPVSTRTRAAMAKAGRRRSRNSPEETSGSRRSIAKGSGSPTVTRGPSVS